MSLIFIFDFFLNLEMIFNMAKSIKKFFIHKVLIKYNMAKDDRSGINPFTGKSHFDIVNDDNFLD